MKRIRSLGLAAVLALALSVLAGVGSASASELSSTESASITGEASGYHYLTTEYWKELACNGSGFSASPEKDKSRLEATIWDSQCLSGGTWKMKANNCKLIYHFGGELADGSFVGSVDIGGAKCTAIEISSFCTTAIGPQEGLAVHYFNTTVGEGNLPAVKIDAVITGLKYTQTGSCGGKTGTFTNGQYQGTWIATDTGLGITLKGAGGSPSIEATSHPVTISGSQDETNPFYLKVAGIEVKCSALALQDESSTGVISSLSLTGEHKGCKSSLGSNTTINMNSCRYYLNVSTVSTGTTGISCTKESDSIEVNTLACMIKVPAQEMGLNSIVGSGPFGASHQVGYYFFTLALKSTVSNIFLCPAKAGTYENGIFTGRINLSAFKTGGAQVGLYATQQR